MAWHPEYRAFHDWVNGELQSHRGTRFTENGPKDSSYVPFHRLQEFWTTERIEPFLYARGHHSPHADILSPEEIRRSYLRIFTILVYISKTPDHPRIHYLDSFARRDLDDANLPFRQEDQPEGLFAGCYNAPADRKSFYESQFLFTPHSLGRMANGKLTRTMYETYLADIEVLPMKLERRIKPAANKVTSVEVVLFSCHPSSGLTTRDGLVIAKIFPPDDVEDAFANERKTYTKVRSENILAYFGSFVQCRRPVILLEYADRGSLVQFFQENDLPSTREELMNMFRDLSLLFKGLAELHNAQPHGPGAVTHVHQDLQPSNIFVFSDVTNGPDDSQYKFLFKLGDFGSSSARTRAEGGNHYYNRTPRVYGAPELMEFDPALVELDTVYTEASDIWSMGCVLLEAAVWSVGGERGRRQFLADRRAETTHKHAKIPACDSTFHNGITILETVRNRPNTLQAQMRVYDTLTKRLWDWICTYLLEHEPSLRLDAKRAGHLMRQQIEGAQEMPPAAFPPDAVPHIHEPSGPVETPRPRPPLPKEVLEDTPPATRRPSSDSGNVSENQKPEKPRNNNHGRNPRYDNLTIERVLLGNPRRPQDLLPAIQSLGDQLQGRDQVFLIDDSWSMKKHWHEVRKTVQALGLVVQGADLDGMELRFTSRPAKKHKCKKAATLVDHVDRNEPQRDGPCLMEPALNTLIDDLMPRVLSISKAKVALASRARNFLRTSGNAASKTGVSVYVLTNAIWGASIDGATNPGGGQQRLFGVDQSVQMLVARLQKENASRSWFTLQFIRFGCNAAARARLRYLDDDLKDTLPGWDIVDTRSYRHGCVRAMLIGALSDVNDESIDSDDNDDDLHDSTPTHTLPTR